MKQYFVCFTGHGAEGFFDRDGDTTTAVDSAETFRLQSEAEKRRKEYAEKWPSMELSVGAGEKALTKAEWREAIISYDSEGGRPEFSDEQNEIIARAFKEISASNHYFGGKNLDESVIPENIPDSELLSYIVELQDTDSGLSPDGSRKEYGGWFNVTVSSDRYIEEMVREDRGDGAEPDWKGISSDFSVIAANFRKLLSAQCPGIRFRDEGSSGGNDISGGSIFYSDPSEMPDFLTSGCEDQRMDGKDFLIDVGNSNSQILSHEKELLQGTRCPDSRYALDGACITLCFQDAPDRLLQAFDSVYALPDKTAVKPVPRRLDFGSASGAVKEIDR
jgi:hypothetical protein